MKHAIRALDFAASLVLLLLMIALTVLISVQIVMRYALGASLPWSLEVSQILFVWIVFVGAALAVKRRQFATMELLAKHLPRWWSRRVVFLVIVAFALCLGIMAGRYLGQTALQRLTMTGLPSTVIYLAPVIASVLMAVFGLEVALKDEKTDQMTQEHLGAGS